MNSFCAADILEFSNAHAYRQFVLPPEDIKRVRILPHPNHFDTAALNINAFVNTQLPVKFFTELFQF